MTPRTSDDLDWPQALNHLSSSSPSSLATKNHQEVDSSVIQPAASETAWYVEKISKQKTATCELFRKPWLPPLFSTVNSVTPISLKIYCVLIILPKTQALKSAANEHKYRMGPEMTRRTDVNLVKQCAKTFSLNEINPQCRRVPDPYFGCYLRDFNFHRALIAEPPTVLTFVELLNS